MSIYGNPVTLGPRWMTAQKVSILPYQNLHGYDHPWPAGGGKNLLPISATASTQYWTNNNDGSWTVNNSSPGSGDLYPSGTTKFMSMGVLPAGTYTASAFSSRETLSNIVTVRIGKGANSTFLISAVGSVQFEADGTSEYWFAMLINASTVVSNHRVWLQCEKASTATDYAPYSNICPISGWEDCRIWVSPTLNPADGMTYQTLFGNPPGTVYGGELNLETGVLTVAHGIIDLGSIGWIYNSASGHERMYTSVAIDNLKPANVGNVETEIPSILCSWYKPSTFAAVRDHTEDNIITQRNMGVQIYSSNMGTNAATFQTTMSGVQLVYELANPVTYQLTPQQISFLSNQYFGANCGPVLIKVGK